MEVPSIEPAVVPIASAIRAPFAFGSWPFSSRRFAWLATPTSVPMVSNMSTIRKAKQMTMKSIPSFHAPLKSNLKNIGAIDGGIEITADGYRLNTPTDGSGTYQPMACAIIPST